MRPHNTLGGKEVGILDEIEDCHTVSHRRIQMGPIGAEQKVASAVHRSQEVGELEIRLHFGSMASQESLLQAGREAQKGNRRFKKYLMGLILS